MMKSITLIIGFLFLSSTLATAQAECVAEPPQGMKEIAAFSIFQSNFKNKEYNLALKFGRWILCDTPETIEGYPGFDLARQLDKFPTIYSQIASNESDPSVKEVYLDSALMAFETKLELFAENKEVIYTTRQRMGRFYLENNSNISDAVSQAYEQFEKMFELNPEKTTNAARGYYIDNLLKNYINKGETEKAQSAIDEASKYATGPIAEMLEGHQKDLFESPEDVIAFYIPVLEENPENLEALNALERAYQEQDNQDELAKIRRKIHEVNPTFESAKSLAETESGNANYDLAIKYYKEALEKASTDPQKKEMNLRLSNSYLNKGEIKTADNFADAAIKVDPNYGLAYINKARVYAAAVTQCTEDRKLEAKDRMVYWLVIDYYNMAKAKDSSVANTVNSQLPNYQRVTPTGEDKFLRLDNLQDGQKVKIDGSVAPCYSWINKTTTVR